MWSLTRDTRSSDRGYIMVALLIGMAVSAVWMSALLPAWRQQSAREKEFELVFRGEQYARAIALFFVKNQTLPPNLDVLVQQRYLRRKYLDPITNKEFLPVGGAQAIGPGRGVGPGRGPGVTATPVPAFAGIFGVRSTSTATAIRTYQGQTTHSQFPFDYQVALQRMGARISGPGLVNQPGRRGGTGPGRGGELPPMTPFRGARGPGVNGPGRRGAAPSPATPGPVFGPQTPPGDQRPGGPFGGPD